MANPVIQIKRSAVAGKIPTTSNLQLGELAVNTYDGKVYIKQDQGGVGVGTTVIAINPWSVGLGSNTYNTYFTAGSVGIGTTNPSQKLEVVGGEIKAGRIDASAEGGQLSFGRSTDNATAWYIDVYGSTSTPDLRVVDVSNAAVRAVFSGSGNFGIKNASPTSALDVSGDAKVSGVVTATTFVGALTGTATTATNVIGGLGSITQLQVSGVSTFTNGPVLVGSSSSTGTPSQPLQVTGGSYISGSVGIGTTNPPDALTTLGRIQIQQDATSNNRLVLRGQPASSYRWSIDNYSSSNTFRIFREDDATAANGSVAVSISTIGTLTATKFSGDGSLLTGITASVTYAPTAGIATYATTAGIATYATTAGVSTYATSSGIATYATTSGVSTSVIGGIASVTQLSVSGVSTLGVTSTTNLITQQLNVSGLSTFAGITTHTASLFGTQASFTGVVTASSFVGNLIGNASSATYATSSGVATYATTAGIATYASTAGIATYATTAGIATYALTSGISTSVIGGIASVTSLSVSGISTLGTVQVSSGIISATSGIVTYYGDGSKLTGIAAVARVTVSSGAPSSPTAGDLWYHTTLARLFVYFNDGDSSQWVDASPFNLQGTGTGANVSVASTAPTSPSSGDLWYNSSYGRLFVYYRDGDSDQWVDAAPFNYQATNAPTKTETSFVATAGQTTFSLTYTVGYVEVYLNGIRLTTSEYTALSGTSVILKEAAAAGDVIDVVQISTGQGPVGATGPQGAASPLAGVATTSSSATYYPVFSAGIGSTTPFISTTSSYFSFIPSSGTLSVNQLNVGVTTLGVTTITNLTSQQINVSGVSTFSSALLGSQASFSGIVTATDFNSTSDYNLKKNIKSIDDPLAKVIKLNGVSFDWKCNGQSSAGVIAQDVEKVLPEIVRDADDGHKTLNYNGLIGLLIEAVKEQNETIKKLEQKINNLEERMN